MLGMSVEEIRPGPGVTYVTNATSNQTKRALRLRVRVHARHAFCRIWARRDLFNAATSYTLVNPVVNLNCISIYFVLTYKFNLE